MNLMSNQNILPEENDFRPSAARLVESLRDTGYSKEAAFSDIIDNSIAANATHIEVDLQYMFGDFKVVITDNGDGMSEDELRNAMRYGSPRRDNPKSLGKFGMGLKTASTAFCRRLVVLSQKDGSKVGRAWDVDKIISSDRWELETPEADDYCGDFDALADFTEDSGTMIIWENIDRLVKKGSDAQMRKQLKCLGDELSQELSAVFFKFIASGEITISMKIGDEPMSELKGWSPLCEDLNKETDGARARVLKEKRIPVEVDGKNYHLRLKVALSLLKMN